MPTPEEMKAAQEAEAKAQAAAAAAQASTEVPPPVETDDPKALKAEVERLRKIASANGKEAAAHRVKLRAVEEEKRKAEADRLTQEGKFKELADARAKEIEAMKAELEPLRSTAATYQQREAEEKQKREAQVAADFAALPDEIRADIPDDADLRTKEVLIKTYQKAAGQKPRPSTLPPTAPVPAAPSGTAPVSDQQLARAYQVRGNPQSSKEDRKAAEETLEKHRAWKASHPG